MNAISSARKVNPRVAMQAPQQMMPSGFQLAPQVPQAIGSQSFQPMAAPMIQPRPAIGGGKGGAYGSGSGVSKGGGGMPVAPTSTGPAIGSSAMPMRGFGGF